MPNFSIDIFMSYSRSDVMFVDSVEKNLHTAGFTTWVDRRKLEGGDRFPDEIRQAITTSQAVIVVLTPRAANSRYVREELQIANELRKPIIPVSLLPCRAPMEISKIHWIDFSKSYESGWKELLIALRRSAIFPSQPSTERPIEVPSPVQLDLWGRWLNIPRVLKVMVSLILTAGIIFTLFKTTYPRGIVVVQPPTPTPKIFHGTIAVYPFPGRINVGGAPNGSITQGPDGNVWFPAGDAIVQMTPAGAFTGFGLTPDSSPTGITNGLDGNLWFSEGDGNRIGRITTIGNIKEFALPSNCGNATYGCSLGGIASGPDGNLWFSETNGNRIGRITVECDDVGDALA